MDMAGGNVKLTEGDDNTSSSSGSATAPSSIAELTFTNSSDKEYMKFNADATVEQGPTSSDSTWKATSTYTYRKDSTSSSKASLYYTVTASQNPWR